MLRLLLRASNFAFFDANVRDETDSCNATMAGLRGCPVEAWCALRLPRSPLPSVVSFAPALLTSECLLALCTEGVAETADAKIMKKTEM
jgi:hypothetical protein